MPVIGLMVTKDDTAVASEWLVHNMPFLSSLVLLDSSSGNETAEAVRSYVQHCPRAAVHYMHERHLVPRLAKFGDQAMRKPVLRRIRELYGHGQWIMVCHMDEFFYHAPKLVAAEVVRQRNVRYASRGPKWSHRCMKVRWYILHVLPHPSEWARYVEEQERAAIDNGISLLVQQRYQHFHTHNTESTKHHQGPDVETRLFLDDARFNYDPDATGVTPASPTCGVIGAVLMHYKVMTPSTGVYSSLGQHQNHWNRGGVGGHLSAGLKGVGIGVRIGNSTRRYRSVRDFFASSYRKYANTVRFSGCLKRVGSNWLPTPIVSEALRAPRTWPLSRGPGLCKESDRNGSSATLRTARRTARRNATQFIARHTARGLQSSAQHPRLLVCILGSLRGGALAWQSLLTHVVDPLNAALGILSARTDPSQDVLFKRATYTWNVTDPADGLGWAAQVDTLAGPPYTWRRYAAASPESGLWGGVQLSQSTASLRGSGVIIFLMRLHLLSRLQPILHLYDQIIVTRGDHYYQCDHPKLDLGSIWVPIGQDWPPGYGERKLLNFNADDCISDRHVVFPSRRGGL